MYHFEPWASSIGFNPCFSGSILKAAIYFQSLKNSHCMTILEMPIMPKNHIIFAIKIAIFHALCMKSCGENP